MKLFTCRNSYNPYTMFWLSVQGHWRSFNVKTKLRRFTLKSTKTSTTIHIFPTWRQLLFFSVAFYAKSELLVLSKFIRTFDRALLHIYIDLIKSDIFPRLYLPPVTITCPRSFRTLRRVRPIVHLVCSFIILSSSSSSSVVVIIFQYAIDIRSRSYNNTIKWPQVYD